MAMVVVTGANRGIGLELCRQYIQEGNQVVGICRQASKELRELPVQIIEGVDVTDEVSIKKVVSELKNQKIDILINNAGILRGDSLESLELEDVLQQFEVNALGPLKVTLALMANLQSGSKVAMITSRMGSIADNSSGGYYGYRSSKAALNMMGMSLAHDLRDRGISVALLHPGFVQTEMTNFQGQIGPGEAARGLRQRIQDLNLENSGHFWHANGELLPW